MATIRGHNGVLEFGTNAVANLTSYTLDTTQDTIETTKMGGTRSRTYTKGLMTFTGSADFQYDDTAPQEGTITELNIFTDTSNTATIKLYPEGDGGAASGDIEITGSVIVTGYSITAAVDGIVTGSLTFQGTDALTYGTL